MESKAQTPTIYFVARSENKKLGPIPATTLSRTGCARSCAFYDEGCYGLYGPGSIHWRKVTAGERAHTPQYVAQQLRATPADQIWRHAVVGDSTTDGHNLDASLLDVLAWGNERRPVIAFTHADVRVGDNLRILHRAAANGFTFNLSGNNPAHADELAQHGLPVVTALPKDAPKALRTPAGREIRTCPATYIEGKQCANCGLCARPDREVVVGFPAHGTGWKKVDLIARKVA